MIYVFIALWMLAGLPSIYITKRYWRARFKEEYEMRIPEFLSVLVGGPCASLGVWAACPYRVWEEVTD